jgi:hypothetical protein
LQASTSPARGEVKMRRALMSDSATDFVNSRC